MQRFVCTKVVLACSRAKGLLLHCCRHTPGRISPTRAPPHCSLFSSQLPSTGEWLGIGTPPPSLCRSSPPSDAHSRGSPGNTLTGPQDGKTLRSLLEPL